MRNNSKFKLLLIIGFVTFLSEISAAKAAKDNIASLSICFAGHCDETQPKDSGPDKGYLACNDDVGPRTIPFYNEDYFTDGACTLYFSNPFTHTTDKLGGFYIQYNPDRSETFRVITFGYRPIVYESGYDFAAQTQGGYYTGIAIYDGKGNPLPFPSPYSNSIKIIVQTMQESATIPAPRLHK